MKRLYLLRHAKAEREDFSTAAHGGDHSRKLTERGETDAALMGRFLAQQDSRPEYIIASNAARTLQTARIVSESWTPPSRIQSEPALYLCGYNEILEHIRALDDIYKSVLLIGHNPDIHHVCLHLAGQMANLSPGMTRIAHHFPTGALAAFDYEQPSWSRLSAAYTHLQSFHIPSDFR